MSHVLISAGTVILTGPPPCISLNAATTSPLSTTASAVTPTWSSTGDAVYRTHVHRARLDLAREDGQGNRGSDRRPGTAGHDTPPLRWARDLRLGGGPGVFRHPENRSALCRTALRAVFADELRGVGLHSGERAFITNYLHWTIRDISHDTCLINHGPWENTAPPISISRKAGRECIRDARTPASVHAMSAVFTTPPRSMMATSCILV